MPIQLFGTEELKQRFLPRCSRRASGRPRSRLSEPEAGSDPGVMIPRPSRDGDEWVITGTEELDHEPRRRRLLRGLRVTDREAGHSRGISAFVVASGPPRFSSASSSTSSASRARPPASRSRRGAHPRRELIGEENKGMHVALGTLDHSRLGVARGVGIAQARPTTPPPTRASAGSSARRSTSSRASIQARRHGDAHRPRRGSCLQGVREGGPRRARHGKYSAMAKLFCSTPRWTSPSRRCRCSAVTATSRSTVERYMRDAKITQIYEGTNEIQRLVIARQLR